MYTIRYEWFIGLLSVVTLSLPCDNVLLRHVTHTCMHDTRLQDMKKCLHIYILLYVSFMVALLWWCYGSRPALTYHNTDKVDYIYQAQETIFSRIYCRDRNYLTIKSATFLHNRWKSCGGFNKIEITNLSARNIPWKGYH